jgi:peptidylprolyl isomerase
MFRALALATALLAPAAHASDWRALDPAQTLVIETTKGAIVVEMRPDFAPLAVDRIKLLAREGVYDGLLFHSIGLSIISSTRPAIPTTRTAGSRATLTWRRSSPSV